MAPTTDHGLETPHEHVVRLYEDDDELAGSIGPYLVEAIQEATFRRGRRSPSQARRFVTCALAAWGCADREDDAALVASELATNAVLHAGTGFTVVLSRRPAGRIRIAVRDTSALRPRARHAGPLDGSGRGLALVEALAADWGVDVVAGGKVVWAELAEACSPAGSLPTGAAVTPN